MPEEPQPAEAQPNGFGRLGRALVDASAWPGWLASWLILGITLAVLLAVLGSLLRLGVLLSWSVELPLLGDQLTLTGLADLQWHLFGIMVMLGGVYALARERHVRVDFIYGHASQRTRDVIDVLGHLFLLLPFCGAMFWLSISFVEFAWRSGEGSDYGGLTDRWIIKLILPTGFLLLGVCGLGKVFIGISRVVAGTPRRTGAEEQRRDG